MRVVVKAYGIICRSKYVSRFTFLGCPYNIFNMGRWKNGKGYWMIHRPNHPFANSSGCVLESRLVMEDHIGRYLQPHENVHHINGNINDNQIENLMLLTKNEHCRLHMIGNSRRKGKKGTNGHLGTKQSEESNLKNRLSHLGRKLSDEAKRKVGIASASRRHSDETKRRISEIKKRWHAERKARLQGSNVDSSLHLSQ